MPRARQGVPARLCFWRINNAGRAPRAGRCRRGGESSRPGVRSFQLVVLCDSPFLTTFAGADRRLVSVWPLGQSRIPVETSFTSRALRPQAIISRYRWVADYAQPHAGLIGYESRAFVLVMVGTERTGVPSIGVRPDPEYRVTRTPTKRLTPKAVFEHPCLHDGSPRWRQTAHAAPVSRNQIEGASMAHHP